MKSENATLGSAAFLALTILTGMAAAPKIANASIDEMTNQAIQAEFGGWTPIVYEGIDGMTDKALLERAVQSDTSRAATSADNTRFSGTITVPKSTLLTTIDNIGEDAKKAGVAYQPSMNILENNGNVRFEVVAFGTSDQCSLFGRILATDSR
jgi:hypothetical protein